ncbi:MAG: SDR family oxidoreductase [Nanoarchaeota archaeon]|nr:SDR family oxidoreductase [Nanoarchaeota archaeon]MBU1269609.1 SDR family oxidoreductase [Nanoarchaeota archaeon]MBU1604966.1 SDR family oxidoreductase [Nanoarchaeota archaeon]MBU2442832.1 SDR family oxidoreductase [Nanoarchaeota archaeon]
MKTILVAGGAGFIGSHLCDELIVQGNKVICMDNLSTGHKNNIKHLLKNKNFKFINHDVIKPFFIKEKIDQIYHLASRASPVDYQKFPVETALSNSIGTNNLVKLALKKNATLLFTSTSEAYGEPKEHPQKESYWGNVNPVGIRSCYDESKRFGEALLMAYHREKKADVKIVRIFNTYGPRLRPGDGRVISNFIRQALTNQPITIYGAGKQTRSFCYISDMVSGLIMMMNSNFVQPKNLGNPDEFTILELAQKVKQLTNSSSPLIFEKLPQDDPTKRQPDISSARKMLGWKPEVELDEGLRQTIEWFKLLPSIRNHNGN